MDQEQLLQENQRLKSRIKVLEKISQLSVSSYGLEHILDTCLEMIVSIMNCDAGSVMYSQENSNELFFISSVGKVAQQVKQFTLRVGEGIAGWVAESGESAIVPDVRKDKRFAAQISSVLQYDVESILAVPIFKRERVTGVLELINRREQETFSEEDLLMGEHFANLLSLLLENYDLHRRTKGRLAELETLLYVSQMVNSNLEIGKLLDTTINLVKEVMEVEGCSLMVYNKEEDILEFVVAKSEVGEQLKDCSIKPGEGIAGKVFETGSALVVNDVQNDSRFCDKMDNLTGFVTKSILCVPLTLKHKVLGTISVINKINEEEFYPEECQLFQAVAHQIAIAIDNAKLFDDIKINYENTVMALIKAVETKDIYTMGHSERTARYAVSMGKKLGLSGDELDQLRRVALLHDIGKIGVPDKILNKPGDLDENEYSRIKTHPIMGEDILQKVGFLKPYAAAVRQHHERLDGSGYPDGLTNTSIFLWARVLGICDAFDAMTSPRAYRDAMPAREAIDKLKREKGSTLDSELCDLFIEIFYEEYADDFDEEQKKFLKNED